MLVKSIFKEIKRALKWPRRLLCLLLNTLYTGAAKLFLSKRTYQYLRTYLSPYRYVWPRHLLRLKMLPESFSQQSFIDYFSGKSVAIIGNAQSLLDSQYGNQIDNHDIVIRINQAKIMDANAQGSKTTIWATIDNFIGTDISYELRVWLGHFFYSKTIRDHKVPNNNVFPLEKTYLYRDTDYYNLYEDSGIRHPTSGFKLIHFILSNTKVLRLDLYGFDFFRTPNYYDQIDYNKRKHNRHTFDKEEKWINQRVENNNKLFLHQ